MVSAMENKTKATGNMHGWPKVSGRSAKGVGQNRQQAKGGLLTQTKQQIDEIGSSHTSGKGITYQESQNFCEHLLLSVSRILAKLLVCSSKVLVSLKRGDRTAMIREIFDPCGRTLAMQE